MDAQATKAQFSLHDNPPLEENRKQGTLQLSLPLPFIQHAKFIIRYFICEGWYNYLHPIHFKMLSGLRHSNYPINLPSFLYNIVKRQATNVQEGKA